MNSNKEIELFILKCASVQQIVEQEVAVSKLQSIAENDAAIKSAVSQFPADLRSNAEQMAEHYKLFYMLENDIRRLIDDIRFKIGTVALADPPFSFKTFSKKSPLNLSGRDASITRSKTFFSVPLEVRYGRFPGILRCDPMGLETLLFSSLLTARLFTINPHLELIEVFFCILPANPS